MASRHQFRQITEFRPGKILVGRTLQDLVAYCVFPLC